MNFKFDIYDITEYYRIYNRESDCLPSGHRHTGHHRSEQNGKRRRAAPCPATKSETTGLNSNGTQCSLHQLGVKSTTIAQSLLPAAKQETTGLGGDGMLCSQQNYRIARRFEALVPTGEAVRLHQ